MPFTAGAEVEVKVGGSLGRWAAGTVIHVEHGCCGQKATYHVQVEGRDATVGERELRRPRRTPAAPGPVSKKAKPRKRNDQVVIGRGPLRFPKYRAWVKSKPCMFCQRKADDPHHWAPRGGKGTGQTTDDTKVVPVCREAHDALHHRRLDELCAFVGTSWAGIDRLILERQLELMTEFLRFHDGVMS